MAEAAFWICIALVTYHHLIYPSLLRLFAWRARQLGPRWTLIPGCLPTLPSVTMVIPARNEQNVIAKKLDNCAALDYPRDLFEVVLVLDGCTDLTGEVARCAIARWPKLRCQVRELPCNHGKARVLNDAIASCTTDVVAVSDASSTLDVDALKRLAAPFSDSQVGVVCPTYEVAPHTLAAERAYWAHQIRIKADEAAVGAPMGAHGACYLIRQRLWTPLASDTINDDFVLPMTIVARGHRAIYDLEVSARELEPTSARQNFSRRVRIGAGNLQQVFQVAGLADPRRPGTAFVFLSGKALRAVVPLLLGVAVCISFGLAVQGHPAFQVLALAELIGSALVISVTLRPRTFPGHLLSLGYVVQSYVAAGLGCLLLLTGRADRVWSVSDSLKPAAESKP